MIVAILIAAGIPLWICAVGIRTLLARGRALLKRPGQCARTCPTPGETRWSRGRGVWVHDVFAFRGLPAFWMEVIAWATDASPRAATEQERKKLRKLGDEPIVVTLMLSDGDAKDVAAPKDTGPSCSAPSLTASTGRASRALKRFTVCPAAERSAAEHGLGKPQMRTVERRPMPENRLRGRRVEGIT
jgi:hypothetical protein